jgi:pre-mRNA cleavage complex 2 protein Pcf11
MEQIELTTASMKKPRLHLISQLYEAKPNICATCGRRFDATAESKEKKARHMDWHFKVKDPDASKRGVHRSWYIGEKEWIDYREVDETASPNEHAATSANNKPKKQAKDRYISVPQDPTLVSAPCPICQEKSITPLALKSIVKVLVYRCLGRLTRCLGRGRRTWEEIWMGKRFALFEQLEHDRSD